MALHALELDKVRAMNEKQRFEYFIKYAGRIEDSPKLCYAIRVGSKTLMSDDTADLRDKFDEFLGPRVPYKITPARFLHEHRCRMILLLGWTRRSFRFKCWWNNGIYSWPRVTANSPHGVKTFQSYWSLWPISVRRMRKE